MDGCTENCKIGCQIQGFMKDFFRRYQVAHGIQWLKGLETHNVVEGIVMRYKADRLFRCEAATIAKKCWTAVMTPANQSCASNDRNHPSPRNEALIDQPLPSTAVCGLSELHYRLVVGFRMLSVDEALVYECASP